jgi:hypothetical protein
MSKWMIFNTAGNGFLAHLAPTNDWKNNADTINTEHGYTHVEQTDDTVWNDLLTLRKTAHYQDGNVVLTDRPLFQNVNNFAADWNNAEPLLNSFEGFTSANNTESFRNQINTYISAVYGIDTSGIDFSADNYRSVEDYCDQNSISFISRLQII